MGRSDWAPLSPPKIPDSCYPTVLRTHRLPGPLPRWPPERQHLSNALPGFELPLTELVELLRWDPSYANRNSYIIKNSNCKYPECPRYGFNIFFCRYLSLTCEFEKRIDGTLQLEAFTTGKAAPSHVQKRQNLEMCNASVSQFQESIRFLKHAAWVSQRIGSWKLQCSSRNRRCGIIRWKT